MLLPCYASGLDDITWTFNQDQTILRRQAGQEEVVETEWQQRVRELSESGSLLLNVTSSAQSEGTYRCTLRNTDGEDVTLIELKILQDPGEGRLLVGICVMLNHLWCEKAKGLQYFDQYTLPFSLTFLIRLITKVKFSIFFFREIFGPSCCRSLSCCSSASSYHHHHHLVTISLLHIGSTVILSEVDHL